MRTVLRLAVAAWLLTAVPLCGQANPAAAKPAEPAASQKGSIQGRVVNAVTDEGLRKVTLMLASASNTGVPVTAETDDTGHFVFQNLPPGRYQLLAERSGFARQVYGSRSNAMTGTSLVLSAAVPEIKDVVFKLAPSSIISGRVLDDEGEPLNNVAVMAMRPAYSRG